MSFINSIYSFSLNDNVSDARYINDEQERALKSHGWRKTTYKGTNIGSYASIERSVPSSPDPLHNEMGTNGRIIAEIERTVPSSPDPLHNEKVINGRIFAEIKREVPSSPDPLHNEMGTNGRIIANRENCTLFS
ncbi:hypothetical protein K1719_027893 [Acacia pycnantha]|nr:hypothetical protein K1719_027893 [Acacia pycnantha]